MFKSIVSGAKKFLALGTGEAAPHGVKAGLKRIPVHLALFGGPSLLATLLIPPGPWKVIPAAIMIGQGLRGELDDVQNGEDTKGKAALDLLSQSGLAILGIFI